MSYIKEIKINGKPYSLGSPLNDTSNHIVDTNNKELYDLMITGSLTPGQKYSVLYAYLDYFYVDFNNMDSRLLIGKPDVNFYIIITAIDEWTLSEECEVSRFDNNYPDIDFSKWKVWYTLNPSIDEYPFLKNFISGNVPFVDRTGQGWIYRMIDEWGNDCPYDFKNIMFRRHFFKTTNSSDLPFDGYVDINRSVEFYDVFNYVYNNIETPLLDITDNYQEFYTFDNGSGVDLSIDGHVKNNKIKYSDKVKKHQYTGYEQINYENTFNSYKKYGFNFMIGSSNNIIEDSINVVIGINSENNKIMDASDIIISNGNWNNTISFSEHIVFTRNSSQWNKIQFCDQLCLNGYCTNNSINGYDYVYMDNGCRYNIIGNEITGPCVESRKLLFLPYCEYNQIGMACEDCKLSNNTRYENLQSGTKKYVN